MTKRLESWERSLVRSSVMPSLKYSWSGSLLRLTKGRTTREGLLGKGSAGACSEGIVAEGGGGRTEKCCTATTTPARSSTPASTRIALRLFVAEMLRATPFSCDRV